MAFVFICATVLLVWNIRELLLNKPNNELSPIVYALIVVFALRGAFVFPEKPVRVAFVLLATNYALRFLLHYSDSSFDVRHTVFVVGSIMKQGAFVLFLWAIAEWLKSVMKVSIPHNSKSTDAAHLP